MPFERGKTICLVDNANIFYGQQAAGWRIDWLKFRSYLERRGALWQTYFFAAEQDPPQEQQTSFYDFLKNYLRWEVVLYPLRIRTIHCANCQHTDIVHTEKGVDIGVATRMVILALQRAYETAILVSGDGDYVETVRFVKSLGLRVEVAAWRGMLAGELAGESSAPVVYLDDLRSDLERER